MIKANHIIRFAEHDFHGGIHPEQHKLLSSETKSEVLPLADELLLPFNSAAVSCGHSEQHQKLEIGERIRFGQALTSASKANSETDAGSEIRTITHAPFDAEVVEISEQNLGHPSALNALSIRIKRFNNHTETPTLKPFRDWQSESTRSLLNRVEQASIVGLGGAVFPTHLKLNVAKLGINTLIINAMECEPYITCDHRLMIENADEIIEGALIAAKIVDANNILIGIEDNKSEAMLALETSILKLKLDEKPKIEIVVTPTKYPSGGEKQLIQILTGKEIPNKSYPASSGIIVQNPATLYSIKKAVVDGFPLTKRLVTITGNACDKPGNYWIPFGTSIKHISEQLEIDLETASEIIFGGPLMGQLINDANVPTNKSTNCIIFNKTRNPSDDEINSGLSLSSKSHLACIRCGECESACPVSLVPQQLYWFSKNEQWNEAEQHSLFDCIECGACSYVCPSEIPLVDYNRFAKTQIKSNMLKLANSDAAKRRFENREARLTRLKLEREQRKRETATARKKAGEKKTDDPEGKKAAIQDALARVKKKKENIT